MEGFERFVDDDRKSNHVDLAYSQLNSFLANCRVEISAILSTQKDVGSKIGASINKFGCAFVQVGGVVDAKIKTNTGKNMALAFDKLSAQVKKDLRSGTFESFGNAWEKGKLKDHEIVLKSSRMPQMVPLLKEGRKAHLHSLTETVHRPNTVAALNNIEMWEILSEHNSNLHPGKWYKNIESHRNAERINVSEDGVKIAVGNSYDLTGIHYDGQLGNEKENNLKRVQIVYANDTGPVRLFIVPGSNQKKFQDLVRIITGVTLKNGFSTHKGLMEKHVKLKTLLLKYGVSLKEAGLIMFEPFVWHYEGVEEKKTFKGRHSLAMVSVNRTLGKGFSGLSDVDPKEYSSVGDVFRIYCGIVSVKKGVSVEHLIVFAYLREHNWAMDPFAGVNKQNDFFVNEKSTQSYLAAKNWVGGPEEWPKLSKASRNTMINYLDKHVSKERLELYGLKPQDLVWNVDE